MSQSISNPQPRTHAQTVRTGSQPAREQLDGVRAGSSMLRMSAKTDRASVIRLLLAVKQKTGTPSKVIAANAEQSESVISESLSMTGTRNFTLEWLCDQDDVFVLAFVESLMQARGITPESKRAAIAEDIGRLVTRLLEYAA